MRQLAFFLLASGLFWTGCIGNDSLGSAAAAQRNIENLARISIGMSDREVFQIMRHPYKSEMFELNGDRYEVWFYITRLMIMDQSEPAHSNLTPLTFKNSTLEGKGYSYYHKVIKQEEAEIETKDQNPPKEDYELEKALKAPPGTKPASPTKPIPTPPAPATPPAKPKPAAKPKPTTPQSQNKPAAPSSGQSAPSTQPSKQSTPATQSGKQPPAPTQPHATQPAAPVQPGSQPAPQKTPTQGNVSMSKTSSKEPPADSEKPTKDQKAAPQKEKSKNNVPLNEEDEKMLQEEQEENFDFW